MAGFAIKLIFTINIYNWLIEMINGVNCNNSMFYVILFALVTKLQLEKSKLQKQINKMQPHQVWFDLMTLVQFF